MATDREKRHIKKAMDRMAERIREENERRERLIRLLEALRMQEREESREEIAMRIYEYKGRQIGALCPGCVMVCGPDDCLYAPNIEIRLNTGDLEKMVASGALDHAFSADDLSSPDYSKKLDQILDNMAAQARAQDIPIQPMKNPGVDNGMKNGEISAENNIDDIDKNADSNAPEERQGDLREIDAGKSAIKEAAVAGANTERENVGLKYQELLEAADEIGGKGQGVEIADVMNDKGMSAADKLNAVNDIQNEAYDAAAMDTAGTNDVSEDITPLSTSKAMRFVE